VRRRDVGVSEFGELLILFSLRVDCIVLANLHCASLPSMRAIYSDQFWVDRCSRDGLRRDAGFA